MTHDCKPRTTEHNQVRIRPPGWTEFHEGIEVDEEMAPLLKLLWELGAETNFSCQGSPKFVDQYEWDARHFRAYIQFVYSDRVQEILVDILTNFYMFREDTEAGQIPISFDLEYDRGPHDGVKRVCVRFPYAEIKHLTAYLQIQVHRSKLGTFTKTALDTAERETIKSVLTADNALPAMSTSEYLQEMKDTYAIQERIVKYIKDDGFVTTARLMQMIPAEPRLIHNAISIMRRRGDIFNSTPNRRTGTWRLREKANA